MQEAISKMCITQFVASTFPENSRHTPKMASIRWTLRAIQKVVKEIVPEIWATPQVPLYLYMAHVRRTGRDAGRDRLVQRYCQRASRSST